MRLCMVFPALFGAPVWSLGGVKQLTGGVLTSADEWKLFVAKADKTLLNTIVHEFSSLEMGAGLGPLANHRQVPEAAKKAFQDFLYTTSNMRSAAPQKVRIFCEFLTTENLHTVSEKIQKGDALPMGISFRREEITKNGRSVIRDAERIKDVKFDGVVQDFYVLAPAKPSSRENESLVEYCLSKGAESQSALVDIKAVPANWFDKDSFRPRSMTSLYFFSSTNERQVIPLRNLYHTLVKGQDTNEKGLGGARNGLFSLPEDSSKPPKGALALASTTKSEQENFISLVEKQPTFFLAIRAAIEDQTFWKKAVKSNVLGVNWMVKKSMPIVLTLIAGMMSYAYLPHLIAHTTSDLVADTVLAFAEHFGSLTQSVTGWRVINISTSYLPGIGLHTQLFRQEMRYRIVDFCKSYGVQVGTTTALSLGMQSLYSWLRGRKSQKLQLQLTKAKKDAAPEDNGKVALANLKKAYESRIQLKWDDSFVVLEDFDVVPHTSVEKLLSPLLRDKFPKVTEYVASWATTISDFFGATRCARRAQNNLRSAVHLSTRTPEAIQGKWRQAVKRGWQGYIFAAPNDVIEADMKTGSGSFNLRSTAPNPFYTVQFTEKDSDTVVAMVSLSETVLSQLFREGKILKGSELPSRPDDFISGPSEDVEMHPASDCAMSVEE